MLVAGVPMPLPPAYFQMETDLLVTDIAGELGPEFLDGFSREVQSMVETEKAKYWVRQSQIANVESQLGRQTLDGLGQKIAAIDARTYFRWLGEDPDFWNDKANIKRFLSDNPECKSPGFWNGLR